MAIGRTNWWQYLAPDSELPPDVTFKVEEEDGGGEVVAHRLLLAGGSRVFRALFFGPMKEQSKVVVIKDTTVEALTIMINFIYQIPDFSLKDIVSCETLFEVFNISKRYQVDELNEMVKEAFRKFTITIENVESVAATAKIYAVFEDTSIGLTGKCHQFLRNNLKTGAAVFDFIMKTKENNPEANLDFIYEILRTKPMTAWQTLFFKPEEQQLVKGQFLTTIPKLPKEWRIKYSFKSTSYNPPKSSSIFMETAVRIYFTNDGFMSVYYTLNGKTNNNKQFQSPAMNVWTAIEMSQLEDDAGKFIFRLLIGEVEVHKEENTKPMEITEAEVRGSRPDLDFPAQPGFIKDFCIESKE